MNKRHYEHTLPNIRGSLSNTYFVAKRLARVLGADKMEDGYLIGNGYAVT